MDLETTLARYGERANEYTQKLGAVDAMNPHDRGLIDNWARDIEGKILDAGCGPGHWTAHLAAAGCDVEGIDPVPEFVSLARERHPDVTYFRGAFADLDAAPVRYGGILAWYSLIHLDPERVVAALMSMYSALAPGGGLLIGFFSAPRTEPFEHAVAPAYYWSVPEMIRALAAAGFEVEGTESRADPGARPHAAITAHGGWVGRGRGRPLRRRPPR